MAVQVQAKELTEQEKLALIAECDHDISEIEESFKNPQSLIAKIWGTDKRDIIQFWGERKEVKYRLLGQTDRISNIANEINQTIFKLTKRDTNYAYQILPAKYKSHEPNPEDECNITPKDSSLNTPRDYKAENSDYIAVLREMKKTIEFAIDKAETSPWKRILVKVLGQDYYDENLRQIKALNTLASDAFDDRRTIPVPTQHLLLWSAYETSVADAFAKYFLEIKPVVLAWFDRKKKRTEFTAKMTRKIITGETPELDELLEPQTRTEARIDGFSGIQCPECNGWRTNLKPGGEGEENWYRCRSWNKRTNEACGHEFKTRFVPLYRNPNGVTIG